MDKKKNNVAAISCLSNSCIVINYAPLFVLNAATQFSVRHLADTVVLDGVMQTAFTSSFSSILLRLFFFLHNRCPPAVKLKKSPNPRPFIVLQFLPT